MPPRGANHAPLVYNKSYTPGVQQNVTYAFPLQHTYTHTHTHFTTIALAASPEDLPDAFFKLPRIRFLLILCKEIARINRHVDARGWGLGCCLGCSETQ